jgi:D-3-phosphoglycerate dehydrogenase / 2-oxoglutarate reductase
VAVLDALEGTLSNALEAAFPPGWLCVQPVDETPESQLEAVRDAEVVFAMWRPVTHQMVHSSPKLKLVQKLGAGVDRIDLDACRQRRVAVARLAGVNAAPVAEHVVMLMLAALRQLPASDRRVKAGEWFKEEARAFQRELRHKRVGLVGLGHVGREVAARLRGFEAEVVYFDVQPAPAEVEARLGITAVDLDQLIRTSDVVSLHVPLLDSTRHLLDDARLRAMKPGAIIVNCARGGLIDERALADALQEGRLAAAALDTFSGEPSPDPSLVRLKNVICTPHSAGATVDNFSLVARRAVRNARDYLAGVPLPEADVAYAPPMAAPIREGQ